MAAHAPYIMPDGRSLTHYLAQEREREQLRRRKAELRGKDLQIAQLVRQRGAAASELELAELKAMENAGVRRRRRWLNDKTLRDLAGPLSAADMEAQFKPAPFGMAVPSPLAQATAPGNAALWDNFRNIDPEKEARVLQKWAAHQRESAPLRRRPLSQAGLALQRWAAVGKKARAALKRANPASVLQLELQILDFFEQAAPDAQMQLPLEEGFARLLVHGLAEFYGLLSVSRTDASGATAVNVYRRTKPLALGGGGGVGQYDISLGLGVSTPLKQPVQQQERSTSASSGARESPSPSPSPSPSHRAGAAGGPFAPSSTSSSLARRNAPSGPSSSAGPSPARAHASGQQAAGTSPSPGRVGGGSGGGRLAGTSPQAARSASGAADGAGHGAPRTGSVGRGGGGGGGGGGGFRGTEQQGVEVDHEITCTDILLAMAEVGQLGLNEDTLRRYVHVHIHGTMPADGQRHYLDHQHSARE